MLLQRGEQVVVTQTLGGSATVQTEMGYLVRISAEDSAALGLTGTAAEATFADGAPFELDQVIAQLKNVFDPEIPINVVDLGPIYLCEAEPLPDGTHRVEIKMSMTAPGCGMGDVLKEDARAAVQSVPASATSTSSWSGTHPGAKTGCRRPPGSNSECSDHEKCTDAN